MELRYCMVNIFTELIILSKNSMLIHFVYAALFVTEDTCVKYLFVSL